jgi:dTDP-4-dehydrorhamnose reductase
MDLLITGAGGQLGLALKSCAKAQGLSALGAGHAQVDVSDRSSVRSWVLAHKPRMVVHCAAWTDVDGCERDRSKAELMNVEGTRSVVAACQEAGSGLVHISSDYVFDGTKGAPYTETDEPRPLSVYGETKLVSERVVQEGGIPEHYVVRTQWLYGAGKKNFPNAILARAKSGEPLRVVDDQTGSPTYALDLARAILVLTGSGRPGLYHASNSGSCTWFDFATHVLEVFGVKGVRVEPIESRELDRPARRPNYSALDNSLLFGTIGYPIPHWKDALRRFREEVEE